MSGCCSRIAGDDWHFEIKEDGASVGFSYSFVVKNEDGDVVLTHSATVPDDADAANGKHDFIIPNELTALVTAGSFSYTLKRIAPTLVTYINGRRFIVELPE